MPTGLLPDAALTDQGQMHDAIRRRRHGALALEFQQFFNVVRSNQTYTQRAMADRPNFNYAHNRFHPIPQSKRDTNKGLWPPAPLPSRPAFSSSP